MTADTAAARARQLRASGVDNSAWNADKAWANGAASDDPASFYNGICAGKKAGDPSTQAAHALPHHYHPDDPPNADGVRNSLSRLPQTDGLTNQAAAQAHLEDHMKVISPDGGSNADTRPASLRARHLESRHSVTEHARMEAFRATWRRELVKVNGKDFAQLDGYASVVGVEYEMWDMFGPYGEQIHPAAFDQTLAAGPDVAFLLNHRGMTMARTIGTPPTLTLDVDPRGLHSQAMVNPERVDVRDMLTAIDDGMITEMSFAFMITDAEWDEAYEHLTILGVDLDRGDVSAVNYGANPYTSIAARSQQIMRDLDGLPAGAQRAAYARLAERFGDFQPAAARPEQPHSHVDADPVSTLVTGRSVGYFDALLRLDS